MSGSHVNPRFMTDASSPLQSDSPSPADTDSRREKLADRLAAQIQDQIVGGGLTEGSSLGSEAELTDQLGVSRWTVREALNILENEGTILIRRGRYGGIFIAAPSADSIGMSIRSYLEFVRVTVDEIVEARRILDEATLQLALERVTPADIVALRQQQNLESETEGLKAGFVQYETLLAVSRSPVLQTFVRAVGQLGMSAILRSTLSDAQLSDTMRVVRLKRREQIEAVIANRIGRALSIEDTILDATSTLLESACPSHDAETAAARLRALHLLDNARRFKRPELLMQEITSDIVARGWPVGEHLGSEAELLARYNVSRSAFREAVRSLEQIGVVEMRTGRRSGLKSGSPNPDKVVSGTVRQFSRLGIAAASFQEALSAIGAPAAALAAQQSAIESDLRELARGPIGPFFSAIGSMSGNRILALFMQILAVNEAGSNDDAPGRKAKPNGHPAQEYDVALAIANSICAGDASLAHRNFLALQAFRAR
ncbi:FadR/GntR family transcriptional regulator [Paraburkholderia phytofirmans]|uniref:FadR/GntR family transcriptional regulator n=1 Tax=Paraburkholderia phytofirmans TaxID=261302 RepID=UPI0038B7515A